MVNCRLILQKHESVQFTLDVIIINDCLIVKKETILPGLCANWVAYHLLFPHADSADADQTGECLSESASWFTTYTTYP